ncbi:MAG: hypothetical protein ACPHE1_05660, partial [Pseudomonadales bacterium]
MKINILIQLLVAIALSVCFGPSWSGDASSSVSQAESFSESRSTSSHELAWQIHERLLALDAHVDIEIPGQPSSY